MGQPAHSLAVCSVLYPDFRKMRQSLTFTNTSKGACINNPSVDRKIPDTVHPTGKYYVPLSVRTNKKAATLKNAGINLK